LNGHIVGAFLERQLRFGMVSIVMLLYNQSEWGIQQVIRFYIQDVMLAKLVLGRKVEIGGGFFPVVETFVLRKGVDPFTGIYKRQLGVGFIFSAFV